MLAEVEPTWWKRRLAYWLDKEKTPAHTWAVGLRGERIVGGRLNRLRRDGWEILHSVQWSSGTDIDHLAIGPPGVFTVNTKHHRGAAVWQGDHAVTVNRSSTRYVPASQSEATRVERLLTARCGFSVPVLPVLAIVGPRHSRSARRLPQCSWWTGRESIKGCPAGRQGCRVSRWRASSPLPAIVGPGWVECGLRPARPVRLLRT
ncbi:nuclease-related domain-containing protein [Kitasatospora kazusensis]|uniref:nuclease-related domain-containing protein n=1 Tax=Kitasatospora kazusensis TaxID=407974 RepID=UPI0031D0FFFF